MQGMREEGATAVGRITKSFGLSGELLIGLFDTFPADFDTREPLFVIIDKLAVPLFCDRFERRGQRSARVVFADFYSEKRTAELIGHELFMEELPDADAGFPDPDADELYPEDLVGFRIVVDRSREGTVAEFIDGENPLFLVSLEGKSVYIPVADEFITQIDVPGREIHMELPDGLLDLND